MPSTSVGNRYAAAVWKFASLLHILPAAGTNSHVHLMRILAQHCAHGGAGRRYSLNLERVSPCHSSCTSPYTRFGNNLRERNDNWQPVCTPLLPAQCTPQSRSNDSLVSSQRPTEPMLYAQPARARRKQPCATLAHTLTQLPEHRTGTGAQPETRVASPWLHTTYRNSATECHNRSVVFRVKAADVGGNRPLRYSAHGPCHIRRHRYGMQ